MGYARHIGRVGALAVTLGVGVAIATMPGTAYAGPTDSSTSPGGSSSTSSSNNTSSTTGTSSAGADGADGTDGADGPDAAPDAGDESVEGSTADGDADGDLTTDVDDTDADLAAGGEGDTDAPPEGEAQEDDSPPTSGNGSSSGGQVSNTSPHGFSVAADSDDSDDSDVADDPDDSEAAHDLSDGQQSQTLSTAAEDNSTNNSFTTTSADARMAATTFSAVVDTPEVPQQRATFVSVVSDFVAAVLSPLLGSGDGVPFQMPILTAILSVARDELERIFLPRNTSPVSQPTVTVFTTQPNLAVDPTTQHVLLIGVDGTNLSRILADPENDNFFALMDESTTAAASIVGHTTISNPSWTAILTGVWGERTGVVNNVFTEGTYDKFPTVFNQLETANPNIKTMAIADWDVIGGIAKSGAAHADEVNNVTQIPGDTDWLATDNKVGAATVAAIASAAPPNFLFSYFVGVDENGHMYGGASEQYKLAIENVDENVGAIMDAASTSGEQWTIIVVTDHGHQPDKGFGHGFQTPDETSTFVIASGTDFEDGWVNPEYQIVDTTPTIVSLFGFQPKAGLDGVTLQSLADSDEHPADLHKALEDEIATNHSPDALTNLALSLRTVFTTVPYYIYDFKNQADAALPSFLLLPVDLLFDGLYVATNIPAQIVALATGVTGATIFPLFPPPPPFPPNEETPSTTTVLLVCATPGSAAGSCAASVA